jgi:hypothetical protein
MGDNNNPVSISSGNCLIKIKQNGLVTAATASGLIKDLCSSLHLLLYFTSHTKREFLIKYKELLFVSFLLHAEEPMRGPDTPVGEEPEMAARQQTIGAGEKRSLLSGWTIVSRQGSRTTRRPHRQSGTSDSSWAYSAHQFGYSLTAFM